MGEAGAGYASHAEIRYTNCKVPASHLIHLEGQGFMLAQQRLGPGRIHHCMRWIGICERALDLMCSRAVARQVSSTEVLADKQTIQYWIAECRTEIDAARLLVLHTAYKIENEGSKAAKQEISSIKFYVAHVLQQVLDKAIQVHGALGMTDNLILSWWYRHERGARIYDGPDEVHKTVVAKAVLKQYYPSKS
ncbi:acyl-CoA dehydrogenase family protein [Reichenbachiella carrageenanivorans]|uniref:acyl-CoA dehydrogenase family protein n=1 Tax=Reichenbachiella carrageenanivorans TaxID=2979869 RepID=UPI0029529569|nr:acyl-CoA dehydrogenase family protein [Reichenbachiella carrageenanivorans]